jgi:hypothetical protein
MARNQKTKKNYKEEIVILVHETPKPKYNWRKHLKPKNQPSFNDLRNIVMKSLVYIEEETGSITTTDVRYQIDLAIKRLTNKLGN